MPKKGTVTSKALKHPLVVEQLTEAGGNLTQKWVTPAKSLRLIHPYLIAFARKAAHMGIQAGVAAPDFKPGWKSRYADQIARTLFGRGIMILIEQTAHELSARFPKAIPIRSDSIKRQLAKLAAIAGQTAGLIKCGIDPDVIRLSDEEMDAMQMRQLQRCLQLGMQVRVLGSTPCSLN